MSNIQMTCAFDNTFIPNAFIDQYMTKANPVFSLVYIYGLRRCMGGAGSLSVSEIGKELNILETDVINAWKHWEKEGLISLAFSGEDGAPGDLTVSFMPVKNKGEKSEKPADARISCIGESGQAVAAPKRKAPAPQAGAKTVILSTRPQYTVQELETYQKQSGEIEDLFSYAEDALGKYLTYNDLNVIFGLYEWLRLPLDVIRYLFSYCADNDKRDLRYIEKVAIDWAENDVRTTERAEEYARAYGGVYKKIMQAMGGAGSFPTTTQKKYADKWLFEYNMPEEAVLEACDRAAVNIGKPSFKYVDGIIENWNKRGIRTVEDIKSDAASFAMKKEAEKTEALPKALSKEKKNRFVNFTQREIDYDKMEALEMEYLRKSLEG